MMSVREEGKAGDKSTLLRNHDRASHTRYDLIAMVASKGGIEAVSQILGSLSPLIPVPVVILIHRGISLPNNQASVLRTRTPLRVRFAEESLRIKPGTVYLAPPHLHLTFDHYRRFALVDGRRICRLRSSADPLFASAAEVFGARLLAVVLTGLGRDGADGVRAVRKHGGMVIAQDQTTSEEFSMPRSAIETGCVDAILPLGEIGPALERLISDELPGRLLSRG